ncbi:hypothetical protein P171DRAFT_426993 [Karstenula rhodostoma CBS 690.94]|uniref:Uncharacterized protein n=1 Tax=Karstenula rhodostoma CBS 690.94 TaxID=1392251 RepID=A0A9P4UHI4_9PLEO|nr:hypothetical protein P171DRAFT_426993 [Karstenula rhodostoma CBS 690.94]
MLLDCKTLWSQEISMRALLPAQQHHLVGMTPQTRRRNRRPYFKQRAAPLQSRPPGLPAQQPPDPLDAYAGVNKQMEGFANAINGAQPGDPRKAAERIADVVRKEGMAEGREMPKRLPLGSDALAVIRGKCEETLKICKEWEEVITSTDFAM